VSYSIKYMRFNPHKQPELLPQVVSCYRKVFSGEPWNEWKKCPMCGQYWGAGQRLTLKQMNFQHCGTAVVDYWPRGIVARDIRHEINDRSSCWLAMDGASVIGFCWGYPISQDTLEEKLGLEGLARTIEHDLRCPWDVAYQDEIGVLPGYRRRGIARWLFEARLDDFLRQGLGLSVVRTKTRPPTVVYHWYLRLGYRVVAEYGDQEGRVVMAKKLYLDSSGDR